MRERFGRFALDDVADDLIAMARMMGHTDAQIIEEALRRSRDTVASHHRTLFRAALRRMHSGQA